MSVHGLPSGTAPRTTPRYHPASHPTTPLEASLPASHHSTEDPGTPQGPRRLVNTRELIAGAGPATSGAAWRLQEPNRDLDSNIIALPAGDGIEAHRGPELDVLIHILDGSGLLGTADGDLPLSAGDLLWMPRHTLRSFTAGAGGLVYHTVHQRKPGLQLQSRRPDTGR